LRGHAVGERIGVLANSMTASGDPARGDLSRVAVIIPALNEAESLQGLLPLLASSSLGQILVCDNGSTDATRELVEAYNASWVYEPKRGYGAACFAGVQRLAPSIEIVVFMDADLSDDVVSLPKLVEPVAGDESDLVLGARVPRRRETGSTTLAQRFANRLFPALIKLGWGYRYTDLGPFRAIRRSSLEAIGMADRAFGWTIEMQIRAVELGLRIREIPVAYRKRQRGRSKISGTTGGVLRAAYWISRTCALLWLTKRRRMRP
jgi:glycosyltransferase involved in cell wall biosynthesis